MLDEVLVVRCPGGNTTLDLVGTIVLGIDTDKIAYARHKPDAIFLAAEASVGLEGKSLVHGSRIGDVHFDGASGSVSGLDVDQVGHAIASPIVHQIGTVVIKVEHSPSDHGVFLETGFIVGYMDLDLVGASVSGLDVDKVLSAVAIDISKRPDTIVFREEDSAVCKNVFLIIHV